MNRNHMTTFHYDDETDARKFRVSDAGRCRLYRYWKRQGKERPQPDAKGLRIMEAGNLYHAYLSYALHASGVLVEAEIEVENEHSTGHADAVVLFDDTYLLYDFKTISSKQAGYMLNNGCKAKKEHQYQMLSYYWLIDNGDISTYEQRMSVVMAPQACRIAYITREEMEIIAEIPVDRNILPQVKEDWQILISAWEKQEEPQPNPEAWECKFCPYKAMCKKSPFSCVGSRKLALIRQPVTLLRATGKVNPSHTRHNPSHTRHNPSPRDGCDG